MNGKKLGCLLLCIVLTGFLVTSCISAENGESEAEVSEREKPLESQNSDRTVVSEVSLTAAYAWDYQKKYPVYDGVYGPAVATEVPFVYGELDGVPYESPTGLSPEDSLHPIIVVISCRGERTQLLEQDLVDWEALVESYGLLPGERCSLMQMPGYRMKLSFADMKQLYRLAQADAYALFFEIDPEHRAPGW